MASALRHTLALRLSRMIPQGGRTAATWAFPVAVGLGWFLWPTLESEYLMEKGLGPDPEHDIKMVADAKMARMEAFEKAKVAASGGVAEEEEEEDAKAVEEEEEEAAEEEEEAAEEEEEAAEEEVAEEEESDDDDDEAEEDEEGVISKPLFDPATGKDLTPEEV
jgi:flagellar biosynthesis GTPase FlhF